jgi:glyoxylase-like metal-dependent hydrolase (beta-lactamase superfamily II)
MARAMLRDASMNSAARNFSQWWSGEAEAAPDRTNVQPFYDERTSTLTYVVWDEATKIGVVIDPVRDLDPRSGHTWLASCESVAAFVNARGLAIPFVLETHAHADHLSGVPFFKKRYGARSVIGAEITRVQATFRHVFGFTDLPVDGRQFDLLVRDAEVLDVGPFRIAVMHTPGHTPACVTYRIGDRIFVGDVMFMPDYGVGRCDFPGGSAEDLWDSIQRLYRLPDDVRVFVGHDYRPGGRPVRWETTIGQQRGANVQLSARTDREAFVPFRRRRDAQLEAPLLLLPSLQVNIRAGELPPVETDGRCYLRLPLKTGAPGAAPA